MALFDSVIVEEESICKATHPTSNWRNKSDQSVKYKYNSYQPLKIACKWK